MKEIMDRFIEWVNKHGGPTPVAIAIGKSPQSFYNYTNRGSKPNMEIFALLVNHFPDFDTDFILTGREKSEREAESKLKALEGKYELLQSMYEEVSAKKKALTPVKVKGAILCPDITRETRKRIAADTMKLQRTGHSSRSISVRVLGTAIPDIMDQVREILG